MGKSVFNNGGYLGVAAALGKAPAPHFKGWRQVYNSNDGTVSMPENAPGDLLVVVGLYAQSGLTLPTGWTLASSANGSAVVGYKYATTNNETSGSWGAYLRTFSLVFSGPVSMGASATYNQWPYVASGTALTCPAITASDFSGFARRFRFICTRTQSAQAATWSTSIPTGNTMLYEVNNYFNATRFFAENSTRLAVSSSALTAGTITLNSGDYTYYSSATVEIRGT